MTLALGCALAGWALPAAAADYDYGDAPFEVELVDEPARALLGGPRLGAAGSADQLDPDTGASVKAGESARGDDDDGVVALDPVPVGRLTTVTVSVAVSQVTVRARLCGWLDLDLDRTFDAGERSCVDIPVGAGSAELRWDGRAADAGASYLRLRIGSVAAEVQSPHGTSRTGEVEDYPVTFLAPAPEPEPGLSLVVTATPDRVSRLGQQVSYGYRVRNTGDLPLARVTLSDLRVPPAGLDCSPALGTILAPGAELRCSATVAVTQDDLDFGALETAAEARAEAPSGATDDPGDDVLAVGPATVEVSQRPGLTVDLATPSDRPTAGESLEVQVGVHNRGNVTLSAVRLSGLRPDLVNVVCEPPTPLTLDPGEGVRCRGRLVVSDAAARRGRLSLRVGARGEGPYGVTGSSWDDVTTSTTIDVALAPPPRSDPGQDREHGGREISTSAPRGPDNLTPSVSLADSGGPARVLLVGGLLGVGLGGTVLASARRRRC